MPPLFSLVSLQLLRETSVFGGASLPTSSKFSNLTLHFTQCPKVLHKLAIYFQFCLLFAPTKQVRLSRFMGNSSFASWF